MVKTMFNKKLQYWGVSVSKTLLLMGSAAVMSACVGKTTSSSSQDTMPSSMSGLSSSTAISTSLPASSVGTVSSVASETSSLPDASSMSGISSSTGFDPGATDVISEDSYDGNIPLDQKVVGQAGAALQTAGNPFADAYFYLSPDVKTMMDSSLDVIKAQGDDDLVNKIKYVQRQPSAVWMDSIATIGGDVAAGRRSLEQHLDAAVEQQRYYAAQNAGQVAPMTVVVIIYNLPDRDCAAFASNGQLIEVGQPADGAAQNGDGYERYRDDYIGEIATIFSKKPEYENLRIVAMLEPDSFPNMVTNTNEGANGEPANSTLNPMPASLPNGGYCDRILSHTGSGAAVTGEGSGDTPNLGLYAAGLRLAIAEFAKIPNVYTYLDIGHAGWLGWDNDTDNDTNMKRGVKYFKQLVDGADGALDGLGLDMIRGFASNTSGYTPVEEPLISNAVADLPALQGFYQWNPAVDEVSYIDQLQKYFTTSGQAFGSASFDANKFGFIVDTARNGWGSDTRPELGSGTKGSDLSNRIDVRAHRGHWCNVNNAGVGEAPKANPDTSRPYLDAFFWMKPPGESDGISFDHTKLSASEIAALDDIDRAVYESATDSVYAGKSLDTMCIPGQAREGVTVDVVPNMAPHAGAWFHKQFIMLINNAHPPLGQSDYD